MNDEKKRFCKYCGSLIDPETNQCSGCGKKPLFLRSKKTIITGASYLLIAFAICGVVFGIVALTNNEKPQGNSDVSVSAPTEQTQIHPIQSTTNTTRTNVKTEAQTNPIHTVYVYVTKSTTRTTKKANTTKATTKPQTTTTSQQGLTQDQKNCVSSLVNLKNSNQERINSINDQLRILESEKEIKLRECAERFANMGMTNSGAYQSAVNSINNSYDGRIKSLQSESSDLQDQNEGINYILNDYDEFMDYYLNYYTK